MRTIFLAGIFLFSLTLNAQDSTSRHTADSLKGALSHLLYNYTSISVNNGFNTELRKDARNRINLDFDYSGNSNTVPATLGLSFVFKRAIPAALKDRVDKRLKNRLKLEDQLRTGINYQHYLKRWKGTIYFGYQHREMRNITGTKETYQLLLYGNARFEDDTVDLSNLLFQNFIYNQYSAGIKKVVEIGKYQMQFGVGLSFLQVINSQEIRTRNAWLYTAPDGEYIDINYDLTFNTAKEGATKFSQINGAGISGDFNVALMNRDKWKLALDVSDVGAVFFRKSPVNYSGVNMVHFQGIVIPDLTSFSSQTFDTLNLDSAVLGNLPKKTRNRYSSTMPFTIGLTFSKPLLKNRLVLTGGLQYRNIPYYYVYGYFKTNYFIKPDMVISGSIGAGGYSLFNLGVEFSKSWKYFDLGLGSGNLLGLAMPSHYTGTSVYLRLASSF